VFSDSTTYRRGYDVTIILYFDRFSFEITKRGEILRVFHPSEDHEILSFKKAFAALFSSKLHSKEEV
jgi:hypothetical protein